MQNQLTHVDKKGDAQMVDVTEKAVTDRLAEAEAWVGMSAKTLKAITSGEIVKGNVFAVARVAGIQAAKRTSELIPLCHPLMLTSIKVNFECHDFSDESYLDENIDTKLGDKKSVDDKSSGIRSVGAPIDTEAAVQIVTRCKLAGQTGVEMEALTAASVAALTVYDMCKALEKSMVIGPIRLLEKSGGKSGDWRAEK